MHTNWCTASLAGAACPQLPGVVPFSRGLVAPDNSWRPETKTSSYKQMLLLLEAEIFYPQSVPFSQAKTIPHRDLTPPQRNKSSPVLRVPETVCSFRHAQPRGERRWSCDFQAWRQGHPCPALFVSTGRSAFDCLTKDEADAGSPGGWVLHCPNISRLGEQGDEVKVSGSQSPLRWVWESSSWACFRQDSCTFWLHLFFCCRRVCL